VAARMLITGGRGILGTDLTGFFSSGYKVCSTGRADFDICNYDQVMSFFEDFKPEYVLHAAALADVDKCEVNQKEAAAINVGGAANIALACREYSAAMVYYSTDYVFDGSKATPYVETDPTDPINFYGRTKLEGEQQVAEILNNAAILRVAWLFGNSERNFIELLIKKGFCQVNQLKSGRQGEEIKVVTDQVGTPTYTWDIARQTEAILRGRIGGLFHCTSEGKASRMEMAEFLFEKLEMDVKLSPCKRNELHWTAARPACTVLENAGLKEFGINIMTDYRDAIDRYLEERRNRHHN